MTNRKLLLSFVGLILSSPSFAFDFEEAATIEGVFRGIVAHCADDTFTKEFIAGSKAQVAFSLQGDDAVLPLELVEALINQNRERPEIKELSDEECSSLLPRFIELHQLRSASLTSSTELTQSLIEAAKNTP